MSTWSRSSIEASETEARARMRSSCILVLILAIGMLSTGCKEGNSLAGGIAPADADFVADELPPGTTEDYVSLRTNFIDGGSIVLDVVVTEVDEPVFGIAMTLSYPAGFAKFTACTDGDLFSPDNCLSSEPEEGVVLISRNSATGSKQVAVLLASAQPKRPRPIA